MAIQALVFTKCNIYHVTTLLVIAHLQHWHEIEAHFKKIYIFPNKHFYMLSAPERKRLIPLVRALTLFFFVAFLLLKPVFLYSSLRWALRLSPLTGRCDSVSRLPWRGIETDPKLWRSRPKSLSALLANVRAHQLYLQLTCIKTWGHGAWLLGVFTKEV